MEIAVDSTPASSFKATAKILDLSSDLPIIVEIADEQEKIDRFLPVLHDLFEQAGCGGLVTIEDVEVIKYVHGKQSQDSDNA